MGAVSHESECPLAHLPILEHQPLRAVRMRYASGACQVCKFTPTPAHGAAIQTKPAFAG